jgi:hypothetical protein
LPAGKASRVATLISALIKRGVAVIIGLQPGEPV